MIKYMIILLYKSFVDNHDHRPNMCLKLYYDDNFKI